MSFQDKLSSNGCASVSNTKLKGRIKAIKEGQLCNASNSIAEQLESSTIAQLRLQHEQVERAHRERIEELKAHLASVIDRTTRIRTAYDKEKRQLLSQVERLTTEHEQAEEAWQAKLSRASESHAQALTARDRDIRILRQQYDDALQSLENFKAETSMQRIQQEERFRCELKRKEQAHGAVLRNARLQQEQTSADLDQARQEIDNAGKSLAAEKRNSEALALQLKTLHQDFNDSKNLERAAQTQVQEWKERLIEEQRKHKQDLDAAAAVAEAQIDAIRQGRSQEIDDIHGKLKDVLHRKNTTVQRLQKSLDEANARISVYEDNMHREKVEILEQMKW